MDPETEAESPGARTESRKQLTALREKMARSSDRAKCNEAKEATARAGGVTFRGSNFIRGPIKRCCPRSVKRRTGSATGRMRWNNSSGPRTRNRRARLADSAYYVSNVSLFDNAVKKGLEYNRRCVLFFLDSHELFRKMLHALQYITLQTGVGDDDATGRFRNRMGGGTVEFRLHKNDGRSRLFFGFRNQ